MDGISGLARTRTSVGNCSNAQPQVREGGREGGVSATNRGIATNVARDADVREGRKE